MYHFQCRLQSGKKKTFIDEKFLKIVLKRHRTFLTKIYNWLYNQNWYKWNRYNYTCNLHSHICSVISILLLQAFRVVLNIKWVVKIDSKEVKWSLDQICFPTGEKRKPWANILFHGGRIFSKNEGIQKPVTTKKR